MIKNLRYRNLLERLCREFPDWGRLDGKTVLITGASGMIGSFLTDALLFRGEAGRERLRVLALGRNPAAAEKRFAHWDGNPAFRFLRHDIREPLPALPWQPDDWVHAASTSHPVAYSTEPINTILANVQGIYQVLEAASKKAGSRVLLLSSVEIYGENRGDTEYFPESYCGYLDCNTLRAGYPEAKRVSEALCQAYIAQKGTDAVILRLPRCYGPTMKRDDSKAIAQFLQKAVRREPIVLKSAGGQLYSFAHVYDAVKGLLWVLLRGETGQAYNLGDEGSNATLKTVAERCARLAGTEVTFELPDAVEKQGYSTASKALLDAGKLRALGWRPSYDLETGLDETVLILRELGQGAEI